MTTHNSKVICEQTGHNASKTVKQIKTIYKLYVTTQNNCVITKSNKNTSIELQKGKLKVKI